MKVLPEFCPNETETIASNAFALPDGLIGFAGYTHAELLYDPKHLPFLWMKLHGPAGSVNFVVLEPGGLIPDYELELFDADAAALDLGGPAEAMVLNIVTLNPQRPLAGTVNLIGPIVVNRRTRVGRQLVIANHSLYSARHPLVDEAADAGRVSA
jgi:flagellar assembly factor FliW